MRCDVMRCDGGGAERIDTDEEKKKKAAATSRRQRNRSSDLSVRRSFCDQREGFYGSWQIKQYVLCCAVLCCAVLRPDVSAMCGVWF
jgi:hypothetical protein